jgi:Ca2+-binding EF-hand superfamily protein
MDSKFPDIDKFLNGKFYQVKEKDAKRIAKRIFQIYDKDASQAISVRECKQILKNIYAGIEPKRIFKENEIKEFLNVLDYNKDGVLTEEDFENTVAQYFVNKNKTGSLDLQQTNPDKFALVHKETYNVDAQDLFDDLYEICSKRFTKGFTDSQLQICTDLFNDFDKNRSGKLDYHEFSAIFKKIYKDIGLVTKKSAPLKEEDIRRLIEMIDYDNDEKISLIEFRIYYLKGILGS